ncbi:MAG TPA: VTT domain-containing protein [Syntrophomonadaceae bacterium]|nr:VTT domain-containing protein [Syntrophomonadaceae bacterium]
MHTDNVPHLFKHLILPLWLCLITAVSGFYWLGSMSNYYRFTLAGVAIVLAGLQILFFNEKKSHASHITNYIIYYFAAIYFLIILIFYVTNLMVLFNYQDLVKVLDQNSDHALLIFMGICFLQPILLPLPEPFTIMAGSAVLGPWKAFIGSYVATTLGIITMFSITRLGGLSIRKRKGNDKALRRYYQYVDKYGQWILIFLLVFPILPDEIICLGAGLSSMSFRRFVPIILIAKIFSSYMLSYFPHLFI